MFRFIRCITSGIVHTASFFFLVAVPLLVTAGVGKYAAGSPPIGTEESASEPSTAASEFGLTIRSTEAKSPEEELASFHLPPGFQVQLFASEPQIAKPLNMAFDARGRLWITQTFEYPTPAPEGQQPRDSIQILEDTNGDGRADKVTTFADKLNIPIGLVPYGDGVICFSIPDIWYLRDTDGDSVCDDRVRLLGPFDTTRDTHGMINSLRRGEDGWIYACHGFNNHSIVTASDGSQIDLTSGNTFRFWPDGSRVEQFTQGQVNPFGMAQDRWGDWYSADCHSKPISRLIRGGSYKSFGRPDNGLGFVPDLMDHLHGSTAISGLVCYDAPNFPNSFRHDFFSGNVMTSRINRNRVVATNDGLVAIEQPDFMTSDDSWFRPVDIQLGPDGAMYVADFYNRIIGHYEVPLEHPDRDRFRGRIWRITGPHRESIRVPSSAVLPRQSDTSRVSHSSVASQLVTELGSDNATRRALALQQICDHHFEASASALHDAISMPGSVHRQVNAMWALARCGELTAAELAAVVHSKEPFAQVHAFRCAAAFPKLADEALLRTASESPIVEDSHARLVISQARMEALASSTGASSFPELIRMATSYPVGSLLHQVGKICVRRALEDSQRRVSLLPDWHQATARKDAEGLLGTAGPHASYLASVLTTIPSSELAEGLFQYMQSSHLQGPQQRVLTDYAIKNLELKNLPSLVAWIRESAADGLDIQAEWLERMRVRSKAAGAESFPELEQWTAHVLNGYLRQVDDLMSGSDSVILGWHAAPLDAKSIRRGAVASSGQNVIWLTENRKAGYQQQDHLYFSSLTLGEKYTGRWISDSFVAPPELTLWVAGHDGIPKDAAQELNSVELVDAISGEVLHYARPPRSDVAKQVTWALGANTGRSVRVSIVDGDAGRTYAWLAVGRFSVSGLNPTPLRTLIDRVAGFLSDAPLDSWQREIESLVSDERLDQRSRFRLAESLTRAKRYLALASVLSAANEMHAWDHLPNPKQMVERLRLDPDVPQANEVAFEFAKSLAQNSPSKLHVEIARPLIAIPAGRILLVQLIEAGQLGIRSVAGLESLLLSGESGTRHDQAGDVKAIVQLKAWCQAADPSSESEDKMLRQRITGIAKASIDLGSGQQLFEKNCQTCHQLSGKGTVIGPQLDGVKTRGLERLSEDILLPHRNVDVAFRTSTVLLEDGTIVAGLVRTKDDSEIRMVKNDGKEVVISVQDVASQRDSQRSLMPDNFGDLLTDEQLANLLAFLAK